MTRSDGERPRIRTDLFTRTVDYTALRVGTVTRRWTWTPRRGPPRRLREVVIRCPHCGRRGAITQVREVMGWDVFVLPRGRQERSVLHSVKDGFEVEACEMLDGGNWYSVGPGGDWTA